MSDETIVAKTLSIIILGLGSFLVGSLPLLLNNLRRRKLVIRPSASSQTSPPFIGHSHDTDSGNGFTSLLQCFNGGVLLFLTLVHLQPEVRTEVEHLQRNGQLPNGSGTMHLGDLIFCGGFFLVFLVEEIVHAFLEKTADHHVVRNQCPESGLYRSLSIKQRSIRISRAALNYSDSTETRMTEDGEHATVPQQNQRPLFVESTISANFLNPNRSRTSVQPSDNTGNERTLHRAHGNSKQSFRGLLTILALSFHEVFEGMTIGLNNHVQDVWYLLIAVATHKLIIAFCIGFELTWANVRKSVLYLYVTTFALVTPLGIIIGMLFTTYGTSIDESPGRISVVLQGLAAGTLLYIVFFEILNRHKQSGFLHLLSTIFGFSVLLVLQIFNHHQHHHHSDHEHEDDHH